MNSIFSRDAQLKSMEQTVTNAEKYLGQFCSVLASYTRKTAKLRDKADLLVTQLCDFSTTEEPELRIGLKNLAEDLAMVQDYRQAQVERLETRVVAPLRSYGDKVKNKRADLKKFTADRNRELKELQKLEKIRLKNPADRQSISQAEVNAQKASNNAYQSTRQMEETISDFQRQKTEDLKRIFTDFITVEMLFHAKALEVYTHTFQNLQCMDTDKDLELFCAKIRMSNTLGGPLETMLTSHFTSAGNHPTSPTMASTRGQSLSPTLSSTRVQGLQSTIASTRNQSLQSTLASTRDKGIPPRGQSRSLQRNKDPPTASRPQTRILRRQKEVEEEEEEEEEDEDDDDDDDDDDEEQDELYESEIEEAQYTHRQSYAAQYAQMRRQHK